MMTGAIGGAADMDDVGSSHRSGRVVISSGEIAGRRQDVLIEDGVIVRIGVVDRDRAELVDADGGAVLCGLHDHHAHLLAFAAARESLLNGFATSFADALCARDRLLPAGVWLRMVGYHESGADVLDRHVLDALVPDRPVRVQHRGGAMWVLNSRGLELVGVDRLNDPGVELDSEGVPNGRLHRLDGWLRRQTRGAVPDLAAAAAELNALGVTGITDATPFADADDLEPLLAAVTAGLPLRIVVTGAPGMAMATESSIVQGPRKLVIPDHELPSLSELIDAFRAARRERLPIAVHSVTLESLMLALAAWEEVGAREGDRLEHGAIIPMAQAPRLAALGIVVVSQPNFIRERGDDYLREVDPRDVSDLYPVARLLDAGVHVGFGTDFPFGRADPWAAVQAAMSRETASGAVIGPDDTVDASYALGRFLAAPLDPGGPPRQVAPCRPADLCILRVPFAEALRAPSAELVAVTIFGGQVVYGRR
jgi:predicted amidohydrolase YtcJ